MQQFFYGTAWKEDETTRLVESALRQGFRAIDTANQRKHYHEAAVGAGIAAAVAAGACLKSDLFLQTKFTFRRGQDQRLPYDPKAPVGRQVEQSFASSLEHLGVSALDSYVLHGPSQGEGLGNDDWEAWQAMEALHDSGAAKSLGVSNVSLEQLDLLCQKARVKPKWVQNRCFAVAGWDFWVRDYCRANEFAYQGFSLLTANQPVLRSAEVAKLAAAYGRTPAQIIFRFALDVGMAPLTGTTDPQHMQQDLAVLDFHLESAEVERIERIAVRR
jgi:diketogulonate reductase-like aldo/keto reductase